jgi:glycosyltransferase involved in cell wall biosynthesis
MPKVKQDRIRVFHLLSSAEIAGGERYLYDLVNYADKLIMHHIILPYKGPFSKILDDSGLPFDIIPLKHKYFLKSIIEIIKLIRIKNINIVHTHGYRANFYGRIACMFTNIKHIATVHVSLFDYNNTPNLLRYLYFVIETVLSFKTFKYICISKAMADDMRRLKIPWQKISIIPNGVDLKRFHPRPVHSKIREKFGVDSKTALIGTAGRLVPEKGQIHLVKALKLLKDKHSNLKCLFLGNGPLLSNIKGKAAAFGVEDMCIFAGTRNDIEEIYPTLDLFVLPSIREPFGLVLLEAMATQIPVLAFSSGGPQEFIKSGLNGVLSPPEDSYRLAEEIQFLLQNRDRAQSLAVEGRKSVEQKYNVKNTVRKIENLYFAL